MEIPAGDEEDAGNNDNQANQTKQQTGRAPRWAVLLLVCCGVVVAGLIALAALARTDEHLDDDEKYTEYFPFYWELEEGGVLMGDTSQWTSIPAGGLEACKYFCDTRQATAGMFFQEQGQVAGFNKRNCFCMNDFLCRAVLTEEEKELYAPVGTAFARAPTEESPVCEQSYCEFDSATCF